MGNVANFATRAIDLRSKAESTLKGGFFTNLFGNKQDRQDEAKDLFQQAANCYKHSNDKEAAVQMYLKCVECETDDGFKANHYKDAARTIA